MKKLISFVAALLFAVSCNMSEYIDGIDVEGKQTIEIPQTENSKPVMSNEGGSAKVGFNAADKWTASVINTRADSWCTVEPSSGKAGPNTVTITAKENTGYDERSASINIQCGGQTHTIVVTQKQKDALTVTSSKFEVKSDGGAVVVEVKANIDFEYAVEGGAAEWIKYEGTRAIKTSSLAFSVLKNEDVERREGKIAIKSGDFNEVVTVYQEGAEPSIVISKSEYMVSSEGETIAVEVATNVDVEVELQGDAGWISKSSTRAISTNTYYFDIQSNSSYDSRSAEIKFTNKANGLSESVKVIQGQKDAIVLAKSEYEFEADGGELEMRIETNVDLSVSVPDSCASWISQIQTRALVEKMLYFQIAPNESYPREGKIVVSGNNVSQEIVIRQNSKDTIDVTIIPDNEIWYTTIDEKPLSLFSDSPYRPDSEFNTQVESNEYDNGIGKIKFKSELTKIHQEAFAYRDNLLTIILPPTVSEIGAEAFAYCDNLKEVNINSAKVTLTQVNPFECCMSLEKFEGPLASDDGRCLVVDGSLYSFAPYGLTEYVTPSGVKIIKDSSFEMAELKKITVSEGVEYIDANAFASTSYTDYHIESSLEYVYLPSTLKGMHPYAFLYNKNIKAFYGDNDFVSADGKCLIDDNYGSYELRTIIAYASGSGVAEYTIPDGVEAIESYSFYYATSLRKLHFPDTFKTIFSRHAFEGATNIESITGKNVLEDGRSMVIDSTLVMYAGAGQDKYVTPEGVKILGYQVLGFNNDIREYVISDEVVAALNYGYIFNQCPNLETVTISANMNYIGYDPFGTESWSTPKIKTVYCRAVVPPIVYYNQSDERFNFDDLTIYVPEQSLEMYSNDSGWAPYAKYLVGYKYEDLPESEFYTSTDFSEDGKVTLMQSATKGDGIDVVFMGDAFSDRLIADGTYDKVMETAAELFFAEEPYKSHREYFNIYSVKAVSYNEVYESGSRTVFSAQFGDGTYISGDDAKVVDYGLLAISEERMDEAMLIVMLNSARYAGTCWMYYPSIESDCGSGLSISYFPTRNNDEELMQVLNHEANGHGFAKLDDEYAYESYGEAPQDYISSRKDMQDNFGWWKNVDFTDDLSIIRWSHFIFDERYQYDGLGAFEGGSTFWTGVWRPTENSIMRYNYGGFNAPSREAIYYRIHKLAYGDSWEYDYEEFVEWDEKNRKTSPEAARPQYVYERKEPLHKPMVVNKTWRDAVKE